MISLARNNQESAEVLGLAGTLREHGIKKMDSLHIACAIRARSGYFLTMDDGILKRDPLIQDIRITDPIGFIKDVLA